MTRLTAHLLDLVKVLHSWVVAFALAVLVAGVWLPIVFDGNTPRPFAEGVVQETSPHSETVVLLDSGEYLSAEHISAPPGERVQVYDSVWNSPSGSPSRWLAWFALVMVGAVGVFVSTLLFAGAGSPFLRRLEVLLRSSGGRGVR